MPLFLSSNSNADKGKRQTADVGVFAMKKIESGTMLRKSKRLP
jgi:hypothetical protein